MHGAMVSLDELKNKYNYNEKVTRSVSVYLRRLERY